MHVSKFPSVTLLALTPDGSAYMNAFLDVAAPSVTLTIIMYETVLTSAALSYLTWQLMDTRILSLEV